MAEAVATSEEYKISRELARAKLETLKSSRRPVARRDYFGDEPSPGGASLGREIVRDLWTGRASSIPNAIEQNEQLAQFRENVGPRARQYGQTQAARAAQRGAKTSQGVEADAQQAAGAFARQAYTRIWQMAEEGIQDFTLAFLISIPISGPVVVAMFLVRLFGGNFMGGAGTVTFREVSVPRVPGYTAAEGVYKFGKIFFIGVLTGLLYTVVLLAIIIVANPGLLVKLALCSALGPLMQFIGINACAQP